MGKFKKGDQVKVTGQSVADFEAWVYRDNGILETVDVVLTESGVDLDDVASMTFSYSDVTAI